ncbi:sphingosine 1-phosphate receptor 4 [Lithobates pipiens]
MMNLTHSQCLESVAKGNINIILLHYNQTGRLNGRPRTSVTFLTILFILISILIIFENFMVLLALLRFLRLKRWVHCCLTNIAFSDLLAGISYLLNICLSGPTTFRLTPQLWFLREGLLFTTLAASTFSLLITAVERYSTMVISMAERQPDKLFRVQGLIILSWVLAAAVGSLPLLGWNCLCHIEDCSSLLPLYSRNYIVFSLGLLGITLLGIIGFYCTIYYFVCTSAKRVAATHQSRRAFHLLQTVLIILGCFVLCWTPLFLFLLVDSACTPPSCQSPLGLEWVLALAVLNSAFNPLIYSLRSSEVRKAIILLLCCACSWAGMQPPACCQQVTEITSGSSNESSIKRRSSLRLSRNLSFRSPVTSVSSVPSQ